MFISVIVPIYNVVRYIPRGFDTLIKQSFKDFEILFVDNGSNDGSYELCSKIADQYDNVSLLCEKTRGAGPARNLGVESAKGEYLCFFDIDDMMYSDALEKIHNHLGGFEYDMLMFGYKEINSISGISNNYIFQNKEYRGNDEIKRDYISEFSGMKFNNGFVWNKVYKKDFIIENNIRFEQLMIQQDEVFNLTVYPKLGSLLTVSDILYDYYVYECGNTRSSYIPKRLEIYKSVRYAFYNLMSQWNLKNSEFENYVRLRFLRSVITNINSNLLTYDNGLSKSEKINKMQKVMHDGDVVSVVSDMPLNSDAWTKLYASAIRNKSIKLYYLIYSYSLALGKFKNIMKRLLKKNSNGASKF